MKTSKHVVFKTIFTFTTFVLNFYHRMKPYSNKRMHYFLYAIESWRGGVFSVRSYCVQEQRQVPLCFPPASATVSLHNLQLETEHSVSNFLIPPKFGYHGLAADSTLALCTLMAAAVGCTKNGQPCRRSSKELHKREKELNLRN